MANEFKRMQKLAGIITESKYYESLNENKEVKVTPEKFKVGDLFVRGEGDSKEKIEILSVNIPDRGNTATIKLKDGKNFKLSSTSLYTIERKKINESQLNENKSKLYAMLADVADEFGKDSDFYSDLEDAVVGWSDRNGELTPKGKLAIKNLLSNWDLLDDYGHFLDENVNEGDEEYYKDAEADDAEHIDALEKDMKDDAKHTSEGKMKMSELKKAIKALAEGEDDVNFNSDTSLYDPVYEAKKDEEVEDIKDVDVTVGDEETMADVTTAEVDPNVKSVQDALTQAQVAAEKLGDDKLTDQIGNTITFFTRTHIVDKPGMTAKSNIKERISKLVKSLNESDKKTFSAMQPIVDDLKAGIETLDRIMERNTDGNSLQQAAKRRGLEGLCIDMIKLWGELRRSVTG